jgi:type III secretion protein T
MNFELIGDSVAAIALTLPRIMAAFLMLPLLTAQNIPPLVRNSFFVSLAIVAFPVSNTGGSVFQSGALLWPVIIMKEVFIGAVIGFAFGIVFWAVGMAGNLIDAKVGSTIASVLDPIQGDSTSLMGRFLSQFAAWLFMASGAFLIFLDLLLGSYSIWPVASYWPEIGVRGEGFLIGQFNYLMTAALVISAPAMVVMMLVDLALGLVNRYAQELQVFTFSMPIKSLIAVWIVLLMLGGIVEITLRKLAENKALLNTLNSLF